MKRLLFLSVFIMHGANVNAETSQTIYKNGMVLSVIPKGSTEPLGVVKDVSTEFKWNAYYSNATLKKYSSKPHWLQWQGFFKVDNSGKHFFVFNGSNDHRTGCEFKATLAGEKVFEFSGNLTKQFGHKTLHLEQGVHPLEIILNCTAYISAWGEIEVKRPGENIVSKIKTGELVHRN